jgi:DNA-3-methyladenine glycosylase I
MTAPATDRVRCAWPRLPLDVAYHDAEWGVPVHDDRVLFEFLLLEAAQAGLSWSTVLAKRENYRRLFAGFDAARVARFDDGDVARLLQDPGIVRHRQKVAGAVTSARAFLAVQEEHGSFDAFLWRFVDGAPITNAWREHREIPTRTALSDALSKELKRRGFSFVGSTICYAYLQAVGVVNDHLVSCYRHREIAEP